MKILYISNSRIPTEKAYGIQIIKMCEAFSLQNNNLKLVLPTRKNKKFKNIDILKYYNIKNNFKIKKIKTFDPVFLMKLPDGVYIKFQLIFFSISSFFYLLFKKNKFVLNHPPNCSSKERAGVQDDKRQVQGDIIFYTRDEYLLPLLQKFSNKVIWEAHTLPDNKNKYLKYWGKCYKIISISQSLKNELVELGIKENKIIVAHDGVDLNNFQKLKQKLNLAENKKVILYSGHLYDWKGAQVLADASEFLPDDCVIVFIGGNDIDIKNFKNKNKILINKNKILVLGYKSPELIPKYLKSADVLILPNSAKYEKSKWTSPMKLFEYMASDRPIIASDLPNIKEVLNENNAIFFKPDNSQDLAKKIESVLNNKNLVDKISQQAYQDVKNYTWDKRAKKILEFIK